MYANQAVLLDIKYFIYCSPCSGDGIGVSENRFKYFQWSHKFWLQGPRSTKSANITVDVDKFSLLLTSAVTHLTNIKEVVDSDEVVCPGCMPSDLLDVGTEGNSVDRLMEIFLSTVRVVDSHPMGWQVAIIGKTQLI